MSISPPKGPRLRRCVECQKEQFVRKDNEPIRCQSCSCRAVGKKGLAVIRSKRIQWQYDGCGDWFYTTLSAKGNKKRHYCSRACHSKSCQMDRVCRQCGKQFSVRQSSISNKTNASGNYCSRKCYEKVLCQPDRVSGRGSQWKRIRKEAVKRAPFCAVCGTLKNLQVHHIIPYRITQDNEQNNLVPLCPSCHKKVEIVTQEVERTGITAPILKICFWSMLQEH